jgi:hypothetical protein
MTTLRSRRTGQDLRDHPLAPPIAPKTLHDAIGCWTVDFDAFRNRIQLISQSARICASLTNLQLDCWRN